MQNSWRTIDVCHAPLAGLPHSCRHSLMGYSFVRSSRRASAQGPRPGSEEGRDAEITACKKAREVLRSAPMLHSDNIRRCSTAPRFLSIRDSQRWREIISWKQGAEKCGRVCCAASRARGHLYLPRGSVAHTNGHLPPIQQQIAHRAPRVSS